MRLKVSRSKNAASLYVTKTIYEGKKQRTITVEKLGTEKDLREKLNGADLYEWARQYIEKLNLEEKKLHREVILKFKQSKLISLNEQRLFNGGYLFLQQLYHCLGLPKICSNISSKYKFTYDLDSALSRLIYGRILYPSSKLNTFEESGKFLEPPDFQLQHVYRALDVICAEDGYIQSELYKNSKSISKRNDKILFYDCTNFFFEIEQEDGLKQYGPSKEHRPNPIVEVTEPKLFVNEIEIIVETFALVKLKECLSRSLVMPGFISIALFHGGKDVEQPFGLSSFLNDFLNPVILAESPKLTDELDFNAVFFCDALGV